MTDRGIALQIGVLTIRWYGVIISLAMLIGIIIAARNAKKRGLSVDELFNIVLVILPSALVGARLYYVIFNWSYYIKDPLMMFKVWHGGLAIHGGIIGAIIALLIYLHVKKGSFWSWADVLIPSVALGQAMGRWGNYLNGEAYGRVTDLPWGILVDGAYHHPTFLYESLWDLAVFFVLLYLIKKPRKDGNIFAWYLILYSTGRFFIEYLRTDSLMLGPIRVAMLISVIGVLIGVFILVFMKKREYFEPRMIKAQPDNTKSKKKKKKKKKK